MSMSDVQKQGQSMSGPPIAYTLPDGRIVHIPYGVCRAAATISYTLSDGCIVDAVIVRGER